MKQKLNDLNVQAFCPECRSIVTFEHKSISGEYGTVTVSKSHQYNGVGYAGIFYKLLRCANCGIGGLAKIHFRMNPQQYELESFLPNSINYAKIPNEVPVGIVKEFREAELCASVGAWRAASAMLRSVLEKTLKENGYNTGSLSDKIDKASNDGIITEARKKRAHEEIRVLGNDILHDEWKEVKDDDFDLSHHYAQRLLEDFYDDRVSVEKILKDKGKFNISSGASANE